ncbi:putative Zn-dependent protease [Thiobacillus denitrificans ATCC 25259]|uniref:Putative Zn-dependent protease n=1 Tax=Thiobacillus denitrificans (strain ATCC 25259 / T1) TaxID=292415 RepID=Q3SH59_THIDA|nr:M48 family metallopeptidase [Thiobacillus denitrificans]AAZ98030.1 putative Zn-dependent protease [Thiobacillus denitrificans ATCC 25259]
MIRFAADYFDGETSRAHAVEASVDAGHLRVRGGAVDFAVSLDRVQVAPPAGQARSVVHLPDARELHSADAAALLELSRLSASARPERWAHLLESRLGFALAALVVSILIVTAGLRWGVPAVAQLAAHALPGWVDERIGEEALALMDELSLSPSTLPAARQQALTQKIADQCRRQTCPSYRLLFRDSKLFGANAMALPGGTVVVTDALVGLARHDEELLAVVAHELGHVRHRHGLRMALQSLGAGAILVAVTGDIGSVTDLAAGLPSLRLQSGYSRDMEREADAYALAWLNTACIPPTRFAAILGRIDDDASDTGLLDSHPGTRERLGPFRGPGRCL